MESIMLSRDINQPNDHAWKMIGIMILSLRFVQGWIFWGGGSRRFFYDPSKLDPYSTQWMANKLQSAMPGALLGSEHLISFMLQHFILLYIAILLFSLAELFSGMALLFGFFTRLSAFITVLISISLMIFFGWQGTTCMDEWTMAVASLSIGLTLILSGSPMYSIDSWWLHRNPKLAQRTWFLMLASGAWSFNQVKKVGFLFLIATLIFTLSTYNYYRGGIISYHEGPVSAYDYHLKLSNGKLNIDDRTVSFTVYVNAGPSAAPTYIIRVELLTSQGKLIKDWGRKQLSELLPEQINNKYPYNQIMIGPYGIIAPVSAEANINLPLEALRIALGNNTYQLQIYTINGQRFDVPLK